jgi:type II secretory ATPase GspE/PulE/Tfp pilus assembly ATPase PilB-like protein
VVDKMDLIRIKHVEKKYRNGVTAIYDLNLAIEKGSFVFVIGGSGSGKSTLIKMLYREEKPTKGQIIVGGLDVAKLRNKKIYKLRRKLGIVFQDYRLLPKLTVYENVAFALEVIGAKKDEIRVRYRIDGELFVATTIAIEKLPQIVGRLKAISNMHQEIQESQDGRILLYDDYNIRVSSQRNVYGEKFVLRLLKKNNSIQSIFDLGYPGTPEDLDKSINKRNSITLIAAPTGEGKTTSLYSMLDYLNKPNINVTTIEDPVEIRIPGLNQIEVDPKSTFSDNLRTILRQDPDIILVGEIRDKETAEIAMQAGQTGHYVLSTIHTIDAVEVITRLRKIGISDYDISSTLATAISQRLVRKICPNCRKERPFNDQEKKIITSIGEKYGIKYDLDNAVTYDAVGCAKCNHSGYAGRIACFEILNLDEETKELIMNGASSIEIRKCALKGTYRPLLVDGINKVVKGITTLDELNRKLRVF